MCEFHGSNANGFGDILWTDNPIYFSSIDGWPLRERLIVVIVSSLPDSASDCTATCILGFSNFLIACLVICAYDIYIMSVHQLVNYPIHHNINRFILPIGYLPSSVAYPGGFSGCPETPPPPAMIFLN